MEMKSHSMTEIEMDKLPTRQKIIQVTLNLIADEGIHGLTTRTIAAAAGVNIAAVNYYFGSKDKLIEESLQSALDHMFSDSFDFLQNLDWKAALQNIMLYFLEGSLRYPGIIKAILHEPINNNNYNTPAMQQFSRFICDTISKFEQSDEKQSDSIRITVLQMLGATFLPALLPDFYKEILGSSFRTDVDAQQKYIDSFFK